MSIESYDPDGNYYYDLPMWDDLDYNSGRSNNWGQEWCAANSGTEIEQLTRGTGVSGYTGCGSCAHSGSAGFSETINCVLKGRAIWWLWAKLAGWGSSEDTESPTVPSGLSLSVVSSSQLDLSWTASTDNVGVTGYRIYSDGTEISTSTGVSYSDTGLTASTTYSYRVLAYDAAGNESGQCTAVSATTDYAQDIIPPVRSNSFPTGELDAGTIAQDISLTTNEDATCKYSTLQSASYVDITEFTNTTGTNHTTEVTGLENGFTYHYYVKCKDASDNINPDDYAITFSVASSPGTNNNTTSKGSGKCFIATAAYGTPLAEEVRVLSKFRDKHLLTNYYGKTFVNLYYKYSPKIADYLRQRDWARIVVRLMLKSLVSITK